MVVTGSDDATADLVLEQLAKDGHPCFRLNSETFPSDLAISVDFQGEHASGCIHCAGRSITLDNIDTVWFRKPNGPGISSSVTNPQARAFAERESTAFLSSVYRLLGDRFWVSHPDAIRKANDKLHQLATAKRLGFAIPRTVVTNDPDTALEFCRSSNMPKAIKPLKAGIVDYPDGRVELIYTSLLTPDDLHNIHQVAFAPCLLQEYVEKKHEVRVTVIGRSVVAVGLDTQGSDASRHDWRRENCRYVRYFETSIPTELERKICEFMDCYDVEFSAFDFIVTPAGEYVFLENNPNGQWAWLDLAIHNGLIGKMAAFLKTGGRSEHRR